MPKALDYFAKGHKVFGAEILNFSNLASVAQIEEILFSPSSNFNDITEATRNCFVYLNCE